MDKFKVEKVNRQCLESNKLKYIMLKELVDHSGPIQDQTFFDNKRNQSSSVNQNFKNQVSFYKLIHFVVDYRAIKTQLKGKPGAEIWNDLVEKSQRKERIVGKNRFL